MRKKPESHEIDYEQASKEFDDLYEKQERVKNMKIAPFIRKYGLPYKVLCDDKRWYRIPYELGGR